jgi:hypothetical protein
MVVYRRRPIGILRAECDGSLAIFNELVLGMECLVIPLVSYLEALRANSLESFIMRTIKLSSFSERLASVSGACIIDIPNPVYPLTLQHAVP